MKPNPVDIKRHGSLGGEEVTMTFDENSIAHIMGVLTDLYSDAEMAIVREYSTNAYDSHVEAGNRAPIEVTLPTILNPVFSVQDYGVGMSREDVIHTYSKYGASTKRNTNEQSGTLGLGCKAALTHTDQFTVTAVKNGIKTIINVSRAQDGTGKMELVDSVPASGPNGVRVDVPVSNPSSVASKAEDFFAYWKSGTVLIDGTPNKFIIDDSDSVIKVDDNTFVVGGQIGADHIVMGNVPYRIDKEHTLLRPSTTYYWNKTHSLVAIVPIGSVDFTPNREDLRYTPRTKAVLSDIRTRTLANLHDIAQKKLDACATKADALEQYINLGMEIEGYQRPTHWNGVQVPNRIDINSMTFDPILKRNQTHRGQYLMAESRKKHFVTGWDGKSLTATNKAKMRTLFNDEVVLVDKLPDWFANASQTTWDAVKAVKLSTDKTRSYGSKPILLWTGAYFDEFEDELDESLPIYYYSPVEGRYDYLLRMVDDDQIVQLGKNRWDKFKRAYPSAKHIRHMWEDKKRQWLDTVPQDVLDSLRLQDRDFKAQLDESKIDDPQLAQEIRLAKKDCSKWSYRFNQFNNNDGEFTPKGIEMTNDYPLLFTYGYNISLHHHTYIYINAVYNSKDD